MGILKNDNGVIFILVGKVKKMTYNGRKMENKLIYLLLGTVCVCVCVEESIRITNRRRW